MYQVTATTMIPDDYQHWELLPSLRLNAAKTVIKELIVGYNPTCSK